MPHTFPSIEAPTKLAATNRSVSITVRPQRDRHEVMSLWKQLAERIPHVPLACSFDWTDVWLNHFGDIVPHEFVLAYDQDNQLRSIVLLTQGIDQTDGPLPLSTLHVGTAGEPDADSVCVEYNDIMVEPEYRELVQTAFCEELNRRANIDQWNLDGFQATDTERFVPQDTASWQVQTELAHWFDLCATREKGCELIDDIRSAHRRKIRKNLGAFPDLRIEWADAISDAAEIFDEMIHLHQNRWTSLGKPGSYASRRFTHFHEELLVRLVPLGQMALVRVRSGNSTVGCLQLFNDNNRALLYQCGWSPHDGQLSPGLVVDFLAMQQCLSRGYDAFDFLAFESQHKRSLSNRATEIVWSRKRHSKVKFALVNYLRLAKRWFCSSSSAKEQ